MTGRRRQRGYALMTALGFLSIMIALSYNFERAMEVNVQYANLAVWGQQARYVAAGGIAEARAVLDAGGDVAALAEEHPLGNGIVRVVAVDARARLHLNAAPAADVAALLGVTVEAVEQGRPLGTVYDAERAFRLSPEAAELVRTHGTVHGGGGLNFDVVPVAVLRALRGVSPAQADALVRHRAGSDGVAGTADDVRVNSAAGLAGVPGLDRETVATLAARIGTDDGWYTVHATGSAGAGKPRLRHARVEVVLQRTEAGWTPVLWVEDFPGS